jgi:hypothetical protein
MPLALWPKCRTVSRSRRCGAGQGPLSDGDPATLWSWPRPPIFLASPPVITPTGQSHAFLPMAAAVPQPHRRSANSKQRLVHGAASIHPPPLAPPVRRMDEPRQQIRLETPQILDDPAPMEQICSNRQLLGIEEKRQRSVDVLQSRPSRRLNQDICTRRRESGETLRLTAMAAHDQPAPTVKGQRPHSDGHPPALYSAEATPIPGHEDGHRHGHNLRTSDPPRRAQPVVWAPSASFFGDVLLAN